MLMAVAAADAAPTPTLFDCYNTPRHGKVQHDSGYFLSAIRVRACACARMPWCGKVTHTRACLCVG